MEAVRIGTVFAHDLNAWRRWRSEINSRRPTYAGGLRGESLEAHARSLRVTAPHLIGSPEQLAAQRAYKAERAAKKAARAAAAKARREAKLAERTSR